MLHRPPGAGQPVRRGLRPDVVARRCRGYGRGKARALGPRPAEGERRGRNLDGRRQQASALHGPGQGQREDLAVEIDKQSRAVDADVRRRAGRLRRLRKGVDQGLHPPVVRLAVADRHARFGACNADRRDLRRGEALGRCERHLHPVEAQVRMIRRSDRDRSRQAGQAEPVDADLGRDAEALQIGLRRRRADSAALDIEGQQRQGDHSGDPAGDRYDAPPIALRLVRHLKASRRHATDALIAGRRP